jgi:2-polyprenyl-3-methyl-5-hydroxy-6-metoxy-1,4-benzoquinol methylase
VQGAPERWLDHPDGRVRVEPRGDGQQAVFVTDTAPDLFVSRRECVTDYPEALIERILEVKGPAYLCDEIQREQDPEYVGLFLRYGLLGFVAEEEFRGARLLDFGSGSGASTVRLARMLPETSVVGVELEEDFVDIARRRIQHRRLPRCEFLLSPSPDSLPDELGTFQFVNLGAVYEHLLPDERRRLIPQLWSLLDPGGVLFVNQLPYRWYPIEQHTTGLPLLNYLPRPLAHRVAAARSQRVDPGASWPELLRAGIRGGSERELRRDIERAGGVAESLTPTQLGLRSHADLWYAYSSRHHPHPVKRAMRAGFRLIRATTGTNFLPGLSLAFRKKS